MQAITATATIQPYSTILHSYNVRMIRNMMPYVQNASKNRMTSTYHLFNYVVQPILNFLAET